ncbi:hypothetical protein [Azospirillum largimobile]
MLELVMEPTNKPRVSDDTDLAPDVEAEEERTRRQQHKFRELMTRLSANAAAMGDSYWTRSPKG